MCDKEIRQARGSSLSAIQKVSRPPAARMKEGWLRIFVLGERSFASHALAPDSRVVIGSSPSCDLVIDEPSIAPRHAVLVCGAGLTLEDLGGGSSVAGTPLRPHQPARIAPGDAVHLGSVLLTVEQRPSAAPRRLLPPDYLELRVEEECLRAERTRSPFALLHLRCPPDAALDDLLSGCLRLQDLVASFGNGEYEVLLLDTQPPHAALVASRIEKGLPGVELKMACWPRDGGSAGALLAAVRGPLQPDAPRLPAMGALGEMIKRVAPTDINVLIWGETGVGKERCAQAVHQGSLRNGKPFVALNCAAFPESLLESELFGHERGAFTGAQQAKQGLLETADGGTVFLDEIGELPQAIQVKLLRVLEERQVMRLGGLKPRPIEVRFVAATNRDLEAEAERGTFRQDLYYRLNGFTLYIPPLRERVQEIELLAVEFAAAASARFGLSQPPRLSREALETLRAYAWPGNIRELRNVVERAVVMCSGGVIEPAHLPASRLLSPFAARKPQRAPAERPAPQPVDDEAGSLFVRVRGALMPDQLRQPLEEFERERIAEALARCGGNQTQAARLLGLSRRTLVKRLTQYRLPRPRLRSEPDAD